MADCCNCCTSTFKIGCIDPCGIIWQSNVQVPAGLAGQWALYIEFNRRNLQFTNELIEGQPINFAVGCLNPFYKYKAYIKKPDGNVAEFTIDGETFDCFKFATPIESPQGVQLNATDVA